MQMAAVASPTSQRPRPETKPTAFRADIQGLRAIAVGVVVLYHLWPNRIGGGFVGVDVFFVISGFLITSHLLTKPPRRFVDIVEFWARRVRRLLPASLFVLLATGVATYLVAPASIWADTGRQILASAFYVVNWDLASSSVDYLAADNAPSPVQHFWSLSVEEQFYFVWPLIIGLAILVGTLIKRVRATIITFILAVFTASLIFSVWFTAANPAPAYFITPTRMWELAAGGVVAILVLHVLPERIPFGSALAWLGLAGIVFSSFVIRPDMAFPGYVALAPVISTSLVILAHARGPLSPLPLLSFRPAQFLGNVSYSVYLWHWPMIVLLPYVSGNLGRLDKAVVIVLSVVLAWITMIVLEKRFRSSHWLSNKRKTFGFAAVGMLLVGSLGASQIWVSNVMAQRSEDQLRTALSEGGPCVGAGALTEDDSIDPACTDQELILDPTAAKTDKPNAYPDDCFSSNPFDVRPQCTYGDGETQVALVGNSHAGHWLPALEVLAEQNDWTITTFLASRCNVSPQRQEFDTEKASQGCQDYEEWVMKETTSGAFDAVITSEKQSAPLDGMTWDETAERAPEGYAEELAQWTEADLDVLVVRDTPYPKGKGINIPDCVAANEDDLSKCSATPEDWHSMDPLAKAAREIKSSDVAVVDPTDWVCPDGMCEPVIGGVITYFDGSHVSATYSKTLAPQFDREIRESSLHSLR